MSNFLGSAPSPAMVKAMAKVAEDCLGAHHPVTKAFGAAVNSNDPIMVELARSLFEELPPGMRNMLWLAAKSRLAGVKKTKISVKRADVPYTAADLSPDRVLH